MNNTITFNITTRDGYYLEDVEIPSENVIIHNPRVKEYGEKTEFWGVIAIVPFYECFFDSVEIENDGWIKSCEVVDEDEIRDLIMERR